MTARVATAEEIMAIQRALKARRLYGAEIDGIAGKQTLDGIRLLQAGAGREVTGILTRADLIDLGIVAPPRPKSKPTLSDFFTKLLVQKGAGLLLSNLKGSPMLSFLDGKKTYLTAILMGLIAVGAMLGITVPGFEGVNAGHLLSEAFAILFLRQGINSALGK
jgi:peptidoglycan hydrolase-like protein with peptidoglycan-binding domain